MILEITNKVEIFFANTLQLCKIEIELQSKIVKSPEEYAEKSKELKVLLEKKQEERHELNNSISSKKSQINKNECAQEIVKDVNDKFSTHISQTCRELKYMLPIFSMHNYQLNKLFTYIKITLQRSIREIKVCEKQI